MPALRDSMPNHGFWMSARAGGASWGIRNRGPTPVI
jgi:hypothetical protein